MSSTVSIICPTFNHERFIKQCIDSVVKQSYQSWELIVLDDHSSDGTYEIVCEQARLDSRIRPYRLEHHGLGRLSEVYNYGLVRSNGRYVAILEGDDFWPPDKLEWQLQGHGSSLMSYGDCVLAFESSKSSRLVRRPPFEGSVGSVDFFRYVLLHESSVIPVTQIFTREALQAIGGFRQEGSPAAVDFPTLLAVSQLTGTFTYIRHPLGFWRQHTMQTTQALGVDLAEHNAALSVECFESLPKEQQSELGITAHLIRESRREALSDVYLNLLRQALRANQREASGRAIHGLLHNGRTLRKLQAIGGFVAIRFGLRVELTELVSRIARYDQNC